MKRFGTMLLAFFLLAGLANAQKITNEQVFQVGYPIQRIGYPVKIVPNTDGAFIYLEYWPQGGMKKYGGTYIQSYGADYKEQWSQPVTKQGTAPFNQIVDLFRLNSSVAVMGYQYSPSVKRDQMKMQLFSLDGQPVGGMQSVSNYTKKDKDFTDNLILSQDKKHLLWVGHNASAGAKKREVVAAVFSDQGNKLWSKRLYLPQLAEENYIVKQSVADNSGNAYFLLTSAELTNTEKDTIFKPLIVRYDHRNNEYTNFRLDFPGSSVQEGRIYITEKNELAFLGILSDGSQSGFLNGANMFETGLSWDNIVYRLFNIQRSLELKSESTTPFPEAWIDRYAERGADFSKSEIIERNGKLYWILEEFYTKEHRGELQHRYYDVAMIALDKETGNADWATSFEKKQRDNNSGRLLSYVRSEHGGKMHFTYLNERGAQGMIVTTSIDLADGSVSRKNLVKNDRATYLFFPQRSVQTAADRVILLGVGNPVGDDYKMIEVSFE